MSENGQKQPHRYTDFMDWNSRPYGPPVKMKMDEQKQGLSSMARNAKILLGMMESMMDYLNFKMGIVNDFIDLQIPTLDVTIWVLEGWVE
jgi:hypothetical protein